MNALPPNSAPLPFGLVAWSWEEQVCRTRNVEAKAEGEQCAREGKVSAQYQAARSGTFPPGLTHSQPPPRQAAATLSRSGEGRARRRPRVLGGPGTQRVRACSTSPLVTPRTAPGVFARACRLPRGRVLRGRGLGRVAHARKRSPGPRASSPPRPAAKRPQSDEDRPPAWSPTSRQSPTQLGRPSQSRLRVGKTVRPSREWRPHCDRLPRC